MAKHKVAKKVASNSPHQSDRIYLADWLRDAYPEIYDQYNAIKDLEESVEQSDMELHYQAQIQKIKMLEEVQKQRLIHIEQLLKEQTK